MFPSARDASNTKAQSLVFHNFEEVSNSLTLYRCPVFVLSILLNWLVFMEVQKGKIPLNYV